MATKPEKPSDEDCCGSGCNPCIFDVYEKKLKLWESEPNSEQTTTLINDIKYSPFVLVGLEQITSDTNLYTFQSVDENLKVKSGEIRLKMGDYLILKGEGKISRPYTPIINKDKQGRFQVIIKLYDDGKMSEILKQTKLNDLFYWRGPYNHLTLKTTKYLLLLGAGTGVAPLYNIAKELVNNEDIETFIKVFACFPNPETILFRDEFKELKTFWNFQSVFYFSNCQAAALRYGEEGRFFKLSREDLEAELKCYGSGSVFVVVCGPDSFNSFCKDALLCCGVVDDNILVM